MRDAIDLGPGGPGARATPWLVAGAVAAVHLATSNLDLAFYDSAELAMVAVQGGLSHPIGQPLHTILGWLLVHVPGVPPLPALVALSAVPAGLAVVPVTRLGEVLGAGAKRFSAGEALVAAGLAGAVALHPSAWEAATRVEVYPLAIALALFATARLVVGLEENGGLGVRGGLGAGALLGLAASANAFVAVLAAAGWLPIVVRAVVVRRARVPGLAAVVAGGVLGLAPYLYVPWAAGRPDVFAWGGGGDPARLAAYFGGADYAENLGGVTLATLAAQVAEWLGWATRAGHLPLLVAGWLLAALAGRRRPDLVIAPIVVAAASVWLIARYRVFHPDIADYVNYQALALLWSAAGLGAALAPGAVRPGGRNPARTRAAAVVTAACLAGLSLASPPPLGARTRHRDHVARELAEATLRSAPPGAVLVFAGDHVLWPVWYLQTVEGVRPDVVAVGHGVAGSSWWWRWMIGRHPWLAALPLRGPGGVPGRLARLRAVDPERPWRVESPALAREVGLPLCGVGLWPRVGEAPCGTDGARPASARLASWRAALGDGAPTTDEVLALVAEQRGDALWALGDGEGAFLAYRAGLPRRDRPPAALAAGLRGRAPPGLGRVPWRARRPLGDPRRLTLRLAQLLMTSGRGDDAAPLMVRAASRGLPEAVAILEAVGGAAGR